MVNSFGIATTLACVTSDMSADIVLRAFRGSRDELPLQLLTPPLLRRRALRSARERAPQNLRVVPNSIKAASAILAP